MHIALVSRVVWGVHGYGGMERYVLEHARFLARAGVGVTLVTMPPAPARRHHAPPPGAWNEPGVELELARAARLPLRGIPDRVINYPYWSYLVGQYLATKDFDLVHAHGMSGWGYARVLARGGARAPLLVTPHGMEEFKTSFAKRLAYTPFHILSRQAARQAAAVIASDSRAVGEVSQYLHVPAERVVLIPNGIDVQAARSHVSVEVQRTLVRRFNLQQRAPLLLSVGRLEPNKGFDLLLNALARIRPSLPSKWLWLLVGEGPERAALERQVRALQLRDHAQLLGAVDETTLHNLYEMATLFVHPTWFEGASIVTLEAMVHARPIVATTAGGIPDKVLPGRNGYLVPPGDVTALGEKILLVLRDARRLREMGAASFDLVCQTFDWARTIQQTLALYEAVTHKPTAQPYWLNLDSDAPVPSG